MQSNNQADLTVMAIGSGKTVGAVAFDIKRLLEKSPGRVLYLCHQTQTLARARKTLEVVLGGAYSYDNFNSTEGRPSSVNMLFATIHAVADRLSAFNPGDFRYVVVGDAHHAQAETIRLIVQYFAADLLRGFAATPRRADSLDVGEFTGWQSGATQETAREIQTASVTRNTRSAKLQTSAYRTDSQLIADLARYIRALGRVPKQHEVRYSRPPYLASFSTYVNRLGWPEGKRLALALLAAEGWQLSVAIAPSAVVKAAPSPTQVFNKAKDLGRLPCASEVEYVEVWQPDLSEWVTEDMPVAGEFLVTSASKSTPAELLTQVLVKAQALGRPPLVREIDADAQANPMMATAEEIKAALRASNWDEVIGHIRQYI